MEGMLVVALTVALTVSWNLKRDQESKTLQKQQTILTFALLDHVKFITFLQIPETFGDLNMYAIIKSKNH